MASGYHRLSSLLTFITQASASVTKKEKFFNWPKVILGWNIDPRENVKEGDVPANPGGITFTCGNMAGSGAATEPTSKLNLGLKSNYWSKLGLVEAKIIYLFKLSMWIPASSSAWTNLS
jgi:hypothetical protein